MNTNNNITNMSNPITATVQKPGQAVNLMTASHQWATRPEDQRFTSLGDLYESVNSRRMNSRAADVDLTNVRVKTNGAGELVVNGLIQPATPSHWAFGQLATVAKAPANYLRTLPQEISVPALNHGLQKLADRDDVKLMTITDPDGGTNTLQAVTSTSYGRIWDADCVQAVQRIVERSGGEFFNPKAYNRFTGESTPSGLYASDRDVFMFMINGGSRLDVGPRAKLNRGFIVSNSEVGNATFKLTTFLFNEVCGNHIIWGAQNINQLCIRHTSGGPSRFDLQAMPTLQAYINSSAAPEEAAIAKAVDRIVLPNGTLEELQAFLSKHGKFTKAEVAGCRAFARAEEGDCKTLWHVVQGLTAYARGFEYIDARVDLETRAGSLLKLASN